MPRTAVLLLLAAIAPIGAAAPQEALRVATTSDTTPLVTFQKDVLPVIEKNCQTCHRPGSIAPMPFLTYEDTRPWAKAIKAAVVTGKMPPWFADPHYGEFRNAPQLTKKDIDILSAWADTGAREGDARTAASTLQQPSEGWRIQPDVVVSMAEPYRIAAKGTGEIREFFVENPFKEDTWISSIEVRPGNPSVVHHVIVQIPESLPPTAGVKFKCADCQIAEVGGRGPSAFQNVITPNSRGNGGTYSNPEFEILSREMETGRGVFTTMEAVYAPGTSPIDYRFTDSAKMVRGGKPIRIEVHYTPNGKETNDQTRIGFTLAKAPARRQFVIMAPEHMADTSNPIPAGTANWETTGELTFRKDAELAWFMPHMHLRGKDMTFRLIFPDGREETVLRASFNFNWQLGYELAKPIRLPKGTRMVVTAHHDNSANNPMNPTPGRPVGWGEMTEQEMMLPWFGVVVEAGAQPDDIASYRPPNLGSLGRGFVMDDAFIQDFSGGIP